MVLSQTGRLYIFTRNDSNGLWLKVQKTSSSGGTPWTPIGEIHSAPAAASDRDGRLEVFGQILFGQVGYTAQKAVDDGWSEPTSVGGKILGTPTIGETSMAAWSCLPATRPTCSRTSGRPLRANTGCRSGSRWDICSGVTLYALAMPTAASRCSPGPACTSAQPVWIEHVESGIGPDKDRVGYPDDLIGWEIGATSMVADRLWAGCLVDAHGSHRSAILLEDVAAYPSNVVRHLLVADLARTVGRLLELLWRTPSASAKNDVGVHLSSFSLDPILVLDEGNVKQFAQPAAFRSA